jgi:hypothetical protein
MIEGEARGLSPGEQHHPLMPSHLLTPHPICLGHRGCGSPPPPATPPRRHFTRQARNRATIAWFRVFGPNPAPRPRIGERVAHPPPL